MRARLKLDTNTWLLAALALAVAPHIPRLPLWITLLCTGVGAMRLFSVKLPARWLLLSLAFAAMTGIFASYHTLLGRDAGVALLIVMLFLKLMEIKSLRDSMVAIFMGYFLVITSFLYSQSIPTGLYLLLTALVITAALIGLSDPAGSLAPRKTLRLAAVLLGQAVPVMLVLFVFFPRVQGPLWGLPIDAYGGMTGLSDTMAMGSISKLSQSGAVAFRVAFDGPPPQPAQRYWRGPVLDTFDGRVWSAGAAQAGNAAPLAVAGQPLGYSLTLEPHNKRWLLALDMPATLPPASRLSASFELLADDPVRQRLRYRAVSYTSYMAGAEPGATEKRRALRLPPGSNPKALELALSWRQSVQDDSEIARRALEMFRREKFFYTLTPPPLAGSNVVDGFLFNTRRGFCEHYAASFVFLMRAAGVPARVVTGYQGGEANPLGNYLIVRQSDAHAWAEVWLDGQGWVRVDPTAAVSPLRVESGLAAALPEGEPLPLLARIDSAWLMQLRMTWDTLNNQWNQWVLGYGQERQYDFLSRLGLEMATREGLIAGLVAGIGMLLLAIAGFMLGQRKPSIDPVAALYLRFCNKLARTGLARRPNEGPADYSRRVATMRPDLAQSVASISALYIALRYRSRPRPELLRRRFKTLVRSFRVKKLSQ